MTPPLPEQAKKLIDKTVDMMRAISVLQAAIIILQEQPKKTGLDAFIHASKIEGLQFSINCLEECIK